MAGRRHEGSRLRPQVPPKPSHGDRGSLKKNDVSNKYQRTFEENVQQFEKIIERYRKMEGECLIDKKTLKTLKDLLKDKQVCISVFGRHNCGKSSFLNAVIGDRLLPVNAINETSVKVVIQHDSRVHVGCCGAHCKRVKDKSPGGLQYCPGLKIVLTDGSSEVISGGVEINQYLTHLNRKIRRQQNQDNLDILSLTIRARVNVLSTAQNEWRVSLVDCPGFGEANEFITQIVQASMNSSAAYIYLTETGAIGGEIERKFFSQLESSDEAALTDGRLIVAVTKFDLNYKTQSSLTTQEENPVTIELLTKSIHDNVFHAKHRRQQTYLKIEPLIPLCSTWALLARRQNAYSCLDWAREAAKELATYPSISEYYVACGQGEHVEEVLKSRKQEELAKWLIVGSGIEALTERIQAMTAAGMKLWTKKVFRMIMKCLNDASATIKEKNESCNRKLKVYREQYDVVKEAYDFVMKTRGELYDSIRCKSAESEVWKKIEDMYPEDTRVSKLMIDVKQMVSDQIEHFQKQCDERIFKPDDKFGPTHFKEDIKKFLDKTSEDLESTFNEAVVFTKMRKVVADYNKVVVKQCARLGFYVLRLSEMVDPNGNLSTVADNHIKHLIEEFEMDQSEPEQLSHTLGPSLGAIKDKVEICSLLGYETETTSYTSRNVREIREILKQVEAEIIEKCKNYFETDVKYSAVKYFYDQYCEDTRESLEEFDRDYLQHLEHVEERLKKAHDVFIQTGKIKQRELPLMHKELSTLKQDLEALAAKTTILV